MAVKLKKGTHEVEFRYCTPGLKIGILVTVLSLLGCGLLIWPDRSKPSTMGSIDHSIA